MEAAFMEFINNFGYFAIAALIFLENVFPPIPSELILPLSGFLCVSSEMILPLVIAFATIGSVLGAYVLYGIGRLLNEDRLFRFFETRPMKLLGFKGDDISKAVSWFNRRGQISVLICRFVPIVRSLISIPAGVAKMNILKFTVYTLIGSAIWNSILCTLGLFAGNAWETVTEQAEWISDIAVYVIAVIVIVVAIFWIMKRIIPNARERKAAKAAAVAGEVTTAQESPSKKDSANGSDGTPTNGGKHIRR